MLCRAVHEHAHRSILSAAPRDAPGPELRRTRRSCRQGEYGTRPCDVRAAAAAPAGVMGARCARRATGSAHERELLDFVLAALAILVALPSCERIQVLRSHHSWPRVPGSYFQAGAGLLAALVVCTLGIAIDADANPWVPYEAVSVGIVGYALARVIGAIFVLDQVLMVSQQTAPLQPGRIDDPGCTACPSHAAVPWARAVMRFAPAGACSPPAGCANMRCTCPVSCLGPARFNPYGIRERKTA
jgi:hypothetical protein